MVVHFEIGSATLTTCPSLIVCLPIRTTGSPDLKPSRISTETPSLNPVFTGTFLAFPSTIANTEFLIFSMTRASAGISSASLFCSATILTVVLAGFLLFAGSEVYWSRMRSITSYEEDESARSRLEVWRGALDLARKYPLTGIGLQNFVLVSPMYTTSRAKTTGEGLEAHNTYLQVLAEGGFPTLIVFFCMLLGAFRKLNRVGRDPPSSGDQAEPSLWQIRSAVLTGLGAFLGQSFFDSNFHKDPLWWFLAFAEALAWVAARQPSAEARGTAPAALAVQRAGTRT